MTNPFENIKEPRFSNPYVYGTPKNMFSRGADVHTYGIYENITTLGLGATVETAITFDGDLYWNRFYCSNIGAVSALGSNRYWVISMPSSGGSMFNLRVIDVTTNTVSYLSYPLGENGANYASGSNAPFILGGKLYLVAARYLPATASYSSKLYVLDPGPTWTLVADNVVWPSGPNAAIGATNLFPSMNNSYNFYPRNLNGLTQDAWWGVKVDSGVGGFSGFYDNPRLLKLSSSGVLTDYTTMPLREDFYQTGLVVTNDRLVMVTDNFTTPREFHKQVFNLTAGVPSFVGDTQITTSGTFPHVEAAREVPVTTASNGYYTMSTTGTELSATLEFKKRTASGDFTITPTISGIVNSNYDIYNNSQFSLLSVAGWDLDSSKNGTALAAIPNEAQIVVGPNPSLDQSKLVLFRADNTLSTYTVPGKMMTAALDPVANRVYAVACYNYGISNANNNVYKVQYTAVV